LARAYPGTRTLDELFHGTKLSDEAKALQILTLLLISEQATASTVPLRVGRGDDACPRAWHLARLEAAARQPLVTGQHHAPVRLTAPLVQLMPHLTGENDHAALMRLAADTLDSASQSEGTPDQTLAQSLTFAARHGLLEP
jgi:hypothetical protein